MIQRVFPIAALVALATFASGARADHTVIQMEVDGMVCAYCAAGIKKALNKRSDITAVDVDMDARTVTAETTPGRGPDDGALRALVKRNGYHVAQIARHDHSLDAGSSQHGTMKTESATHSDVIHDHNHSDETEHGHGGHHD